MLPRSLYNRSAFTSQRQYSALHFLFSTLCYVRVYLALFLYGWIWYNFTRWSWSLPKIITGVPPVLSGSFYLHRSTNSTTEWIYTKHAQMSALGRKTDDLLLSNYCLYKDKVIYSRRNAVTSSARNGPVYAGTPCLNFFLFLNFIPALTNIHYSHLFFYSDGISLFRF
jgi:hypothetical protein